MPMRFLMFGISPGFGGTESVIYSMLEEWHKYGLDFDFINTFDTPLAKEKWLTSLGCHVFKLNLRKRGRFFQYKKELAKFFKEHGKQYDGVWLNIQDPDGGDLLKVAKHFGIKRRIVIAHNAGRPTGLDLLRHISEHFSRCAINTYATHKIAVSSLAGKITYGSEEAFEVIRNGIDVNRFAFLQSKRERVRSELNISVEDRLVLFAGRLEEQKNPFFALGIFEHMQQSDSRLRFALIGDGSLSASLHKAVMNKEPNESVVFVHGCSDISAYLCAADYFVFPSLYEGMGMAIIEAQCSGLPCFASDGPIPKEAKVTDLVTWIPLSGGPAAWAETILKASPCPNRESYYKNLLDSGLDNHTVAHQYLKLLCL